MNKVLKLSEIFEQKNEKVGNLDIRPFSCTNEGIFPRDEKFSKKLSKSLAKNKIANKGDFVFGMSRKILNYGMMRYEEGCFSGAYKVYKCKFGYEFSIFLDLYIKFNHDYFYQCIVGGAREGQSISEDILFDLEVEVPTEDQLKNILKFYHIIDEQIKLKEEIIYNLEEISKTIFNSWFIDFDPVRAKIDGKPTGLSREISDLFPDSFEDSELGEIPKGWEYCAISNKYDFLSGYAFKSKDWTEEGVPVVKIKSIQSGFIDLDTDTFVTEEFLGTKSSYILNEGDLLIAMTGATIGKVGIVPISTEKPLLNQRVGKFIHKDNTKNFFLDCFVSSEVFLKNIENLATGSARDNISKDQILSIKTVIPADDIYIKFGEITEDIRKKILNAQHENQILETLRDTLLPSLLSNDLKIPNIENFIEEAGI